jgi:hypothetical protein
LQGEIKKIKLAIFNGGHRKGEEDETWMPEMKKYFQLHDYTSRVETITATYTCKERQPCGGINLSKPNTLMRQRSHEENSKDNSKRNIFPSITTKGR